MSTIKLRLGTHWTRTVTFDHAAGMTEFKDQGAIVAEVEMAYDDPRLAELKTRWTRGELTDAQLEAALEPYLT